MSKIYFFVGPYVECHSPEDVWPADPALADAWSDLLNDQRRMEWNMPLGNAQTVMVDGVKTYQYCGVPIENRAGVPRWPMLFKLEESLTESASFNWRALEPDGEIEWFERAYGEEIALLRRIFTNPPELHWGAVYWPR